MSDDWDFGDRVHRGDHVGRGWTRLSGEGRRPEELDDADDAAMLAEEARTTAQEPPQGPRLPRLRLLRSGVDEDPATIVEPEPVPASPPVAYDPELAVSAIGKLAKGGDPWAIRIVREWLTQRTSPGSESEENQ